MQELLIIMTIMIKAELGGLDRTTVVNIAFCESSYDPKAKSKTSSAKGLFQFIDKSWNYYGKQLWGDELKNKDPLNPQHNTDLAIYVMQKRGFKNWSESKPCWEKL